MAKKKYYAVVKGRRPGLYQRWEGPAGAEEQVRGFAGAVFRGFESLDEARAYLDSGGAVRIQQPALLDGEDASPPSHRLRPTPDFQADLQAGAVVIFTDGACSGNPGPGGYGVVVWDGDTRKEYSGGFRCTTNNRMELTACLVGLRSVERAAPVIIYSDSRHVVDSVTLGWAVRWRRDGWLRAPNGQKERLPVENVDLWRALLDQLDRLPVTFRWVKGHASHPENERCDRLAVAAARAAGLPPDPGFRGSC